MPSSAVFNFKGADEVGSPLLLADNEYNTDMFSTAVC